MIHVNIKITILVFVKTSKLEKDLQWKTFKTYLDILRMEHNDFPEIKQLKFGFLPGPVTTPHCDFLKYLRNKPELIYNILSIDIEENKNRRKKNKKEYLEKESENKVKDGIKNLKKEFEKKKKEIEENS